MGINTLHLGWGILLHNTKRLSCLGISSAGSGFTGLSPVTGITRIVPLCFVIFDLKPFLSGACGNELDFSWRMRGISISIFFHNLEAVFASTYLKHNLQITPRIQPLLMTLQYSPASLDISWTNLSPRNLYSSRSAFASTRATRHDRHLKKLLDPKPGNLGYLSSREASFNPYRASLDVQNFVLDDSGSTNPSGCANINLLTSRTLRNCRVHVHSGKIGKDCAGSCQTDEGHHALLLSIRNQANLHSSNVFQFNTILTNLGEWIGYLLVIGVFLSMRVCRVDGLIVKVEYFVEGCVCGTELSVE
ncbi:hypothetical protein Tco_0588423 [Tanacetum coccineum]